jgi:hypothetical protein
VINIEIKKEQFKSYDGIHELVIIHSSHVRSLDIAQYILDMQSEIVMLKNIIEDYRQKEKKLEKIPKQTMKPSLEEEW